MRNHSIFALAIIALLVVTAAEAKYCGGDGSAGNPYRICTAEDMNAIGANPADWNKHFILVNDVNLAQYTGTKFKIIGNSITPFTGVFDGNDHKVWNFTWSSTGRNGIGLFGYVGPGGQIKNLGMENVNVNAGTGGGVGGLVASNSGTISSCYSTGSVSGYSGVGGLAGDNSGTITNCYSTGSISGGSYVGGLAASNSGTITNCYSTGDVSGSCMVTSFYRVSVGGLVADNSGTITNCYSSGNVSGTGTMDWSFLVDNWVGGLVGINSGPITNCYSTGIVSGSVKYDWYGCYENYVGGLVGYNYGTYARITNCYSRGSVSGTGGYGNWVGGLVGINSGSITYCYSIGSVSISGAYAYGFVGGLVGYGGEVICSFWNIETSGRNTSAGGAPKTTAEMKMASTYIGWGGCDNNDVWTIDEGNEYPHLAWEGKPGQSIAEQHLSDYVPGSGTESDPYLISTAQQLLICSFPCEWDKHFALVADINLGTQVNIIGTPIRPFTGVFDGNDHKIWNFTWDSNGASYIGLFGYVAGTGQIKNVGMENVNINAANGDYIGGLVGDNNDGTITNCYSTADVNGTGGYGGLVGGLVGWNEENGTISNCYAMGSVSVDSGSSLVGGLVGDNSGTINNCYSDANVSGSSGVGNDVGGLVGYNSGTINNCYSTGSVSGTVSGYANIVGGLVGINSGGTVNDSYSTGNVNGTGGYGGIVGGLVGSNGGMITNCYSMGSVSVDSGSSLVGGLVGENGGTITNCYSTGSVTAEYSYVGGLVGDNYGTITNCYSTGRVIGSGASGGLVGENNIGTITNCYSTGRVTGDYYVGGLVGYGDANDVNASFWDVETSGQSKSGGGTGKLTDEMKTKSTFTNAGWDFVGETANGTNDYWRMCVDGVNYPLLSWQFVPDFVCPDGVDFLDFAVLGSAWLSNVIDPYWNPICDISEPKDNVIDERDLAVFCENWLEGM